MACLTEGMWFNYRSPRSNFPLSWHEISSPSEIEINTVNKEIVSWKILNKLIKENKENKEKERRRKETNIASIG